MMLRRPPQLITRVEATRIAKDYIDAEELLALFFKFTISYKTPTNYNCASCKGALTSTPTQEGLGKHQFQHDATQIKLDAEPILFRYSCKEIIYDEDSAYEHYVDCAPLWKPRHSTMQENLEFMALYVNQEVLEDKKGVPQPEYSKPGVLLRRAISLSAFDMVYHSPARREAVVITVNKSSDTEVDV
ncbi:hypothetical protein CC86DRAFT_377416 [Ophiobolus disseminans]|uniref:Uncharacterized protein n=1 Tax=Ophiobolus disseminans TaxID=1469910 RepID=A0A6A7AG14_9PLEO|nr:hypothetical protein CC86DRAFT_377416 [Ophiobolus disseminans]